MYLPVRVSMRIFSPVLMKSGTWSVMPVSRVDRLLDVVGGVAANAIRGVGHGQHHTGGQFDGDGLFLDEGHRDRRVLDEVIRWRRPQSRA